MNLAMAREADVCRSTSGYLWWSVQTATSRGPKADSSVLPRIKRFWFDFSFTIKFAWSAMFAMTMCLIF